MWIETYVVVEGDVRIEVGVDVKVGVQVWMGTLDSVVVGARKMVELNVRVEVVARIREVGQPTRGTASTKRLIPVLPSCPKYAISTPSRSTCWMAGTLVRRKDASEGTQPASVRASWRVSLS